MNIRIFDRTDITGYRKEKTNIHSFYVKDLWLFINQPLLHAVCVWSSQFKRIWIM